MAGLHALLNGTPGQVRKEAAMSLSTSAVGRARHLLSLFIPYKLLPTLNVSMAPVTS